MESALTTPSRRAPESPATRFASNSSKRPRKVATTMCLTAKCAEEWTGSSVQVPVGTAVAVVEVADMIPSDLGVNRTAVRLLIWTVAPKRTTVQLALMDLPSLPIADVPTTATERADAARNRERILCQAARLVEELGAEAVSMDAIAEAAQVGKGTLFRRFGSRDAL